MTTFSYDFTDTGEFGDYVTLTPARYVFKFVKVEKGTSAAGNPKAIVTLQVVAGGPEIYRDGLITQHWPTGGAGGGRFRAFMNALGIKTKDRGKVNLAQYYGSEIGASVELQLGDTPREDGSDMYFHNLRNIQPGDQYREMLGIGSDEDEEEEPDEEEEEENEEEEEDEGEEDEDEGDDEDDDDEEPWTADDFEGMSLKELKVIAEENDISTKPAEGKSKLSAAVMRTRLVDALVEDEEEEGEEEDEEEEEEEEEEVEEEDWTADDIDELNIYDLRSLAKEWEVSTKPARGKKSASAALLRKRLKDALEAQEEEDERDDDEEPF